jgi:hypothetical protein
MPAINDTVTLDGINKKNEMAEKMDQLIGSLSFQEDHTSYL